MITLGELSEVTYLRTDDFTDEACARILAELSAARREKAERYRSPKDRYVSAGAGFLLDCALRKAGLCEKDAKFVYGKHGKPYLEAGGVYFNLSHSGTVAVCAVSRQEVGVDVQAVVPVKEALMRRVCSDREFSRLSLLPVREREEEFCRLWTIKESVMKFTGEGLSLLPQRVEAELSDSTKVTCGGRALSVKEFVLEGYRLAVCTAAEEEFILTEMSAER